MESLRLLRGIPSPPGAVGIDLRAHHYHHPPAQVCAAGTRAAAPAGGGTAPETAAALPRRSYMFARPLRRLWPGGGEKEKDEDGVAVVEEGDGLAAVDGRREGNWVMKILRVGSQWAAERADGGGDKEAGDDGGDRCVDCRGEDGSGGCGVQGGDEEEEEEEEEEPVVFDRESFSRLLRRVSLAEAELYARMSYLSNLAYNIPQIKHANLLKYHGLRFVTSSLEKKAKSSNTEEQSPAQDQEPEGKIGNSKEYEEQGKHSNGISASAAYRIAASAASYLQSQTKGILPFSSRKAQIGEDSLGGGSRSEDELISTSSKVASFVATTNSVTAVVAGKEEMKEAVAKDLSSAQSSPCEWYVCDDDSSGTRYIIIQGSDSVASWQTNLLFEPIQFEGLDVLVHRGIYEAAKGIYQQILPEIQAHLNSRGNSAALRFTGHSLGGSLALLVNLLLLIRGDAPPSSLLPVITLGAPSIMCGGDYLLRKLGLPQSHVQAIAMHRDIVPRAFSCNYPDHVIKILTAINGNFRNHPCLKNQKLLYAPMGKFLILQPEEKFSPHHHLLPPGSGLYLLGHSLPDSDDSMKLLRAAQSAFLNSPHPLEMLSDRSAYGSYGTVYRDHDMRAYLRSVRAVIRLELKLVRKAKREGRRLLWWPLVSVEGIHSDIVTDRRPGLTNSSSHEFNFTGVIRGGKERLERFGRMVASHHLHMFILLLFPARLLILGALSLVNFR